MKLDKVNTKIMAELLYDCRQTNIQLGKKVGLSREGVAYRVKRLEELDVVKGYTIEVNANKLGYSMHEVFIKLQGADDRELMQGLMDNPNIVFIEKILGRYDLVLMLMVRTTKELDTELSRIRQLCGIGLKDMEISTWAANYDTMSSLFGKPYSANAALEDKTYRLDDIEKDLLKELTKDSTISAVDLAEKLKVSAVTVASKIRKLRKETVIKIFRAQIDFEKLGVHRYALMLSVSGDVEKKLAEFCRRHKQIADFTKFIGKYNYIAEIFAADNGEFKKVVDDVLSGFKENVITYDTLILLEELKHRFRV